jgi:integrase
MPMMFTQAAVERLKPHSNTKRRVIRDAASQALFLVIQPSGHKSWMMRFRYGDGAAKIFLGPLDVSDRRHDGELEIGQPLSLPQARQLASRVNADRAAGVDVVAAHRGRRHRQSIKLAEAATNSFAAAVKDFVEQHAKPKTRGWKETATNLGLDAELNVKPGGVAHRWNDRDVRSIAAADLFVVIEEARRFSIPGTKAKTSTASEVRARKLHCSLSVLFGWLHRRRRIEVNPMTSLHLPALPPSRDRVLSDAEIAAFWAAAAAANEPFTAVLRLLLLTGCRLNEIARLEWSEVSEDCAAIALPGARTKNHRPFAIPLPQMARDLIAAQPHNGRYVFSTSGGIAPVSGWSRAKRRVDAAAAIPAWVIHDLRRTCSTGMAEIGVPPHVVEAVLNHISGAKAGVAGTYNRAAYAAEKKEALERWADHLETIVSGLQKVVPIRRGQ